MANLTIVHSSPKRCLAAEYATSDRASKRLRSMDCQQHCKILQPHHRPSCEYSRVSSQKAMSEQPFRLFDLPTEVRLEIYRACITRPYNIVLSRTPSPTPTWDENEYVDMYDRPRRRSSRLRACRAEEVIHRRRSEIPEPGSMAVASHRTSLIRSDEKTVRKREKKPQDDDPLLVNLLVTCQLVYREARPVLYGENKFDIRLDTARSTLAALHQRSRGTIHSLRLVLPPGNEALERFAELVRLSLRYCWRLRTFTINMAHSHDNSVFANIYANAFDNLRWLNKDCKIILEGRVDPEVEKVIQVKAALAKSLDATAYARRQLMASDKSFPLFSAAAAIRKRG